MDDFAKVVPLLTALFAGYMFFRTVGNRAVRHEIIRLAHDFERARIEMIRSREKEQEQSIAVHSRL